MNNTSPISPTGRIVACLGASATVAIGSYDWIRDLEQRPGNEHLHFYRFAEGGDLAYNGLRRLPAIVKRRPDDVIILLGDNDVMAAASPKFAAYVQRTKHLPCPASEDGYRENMQTIVHRLKNETHARLAVCSLIPVGEDPTSANPFQAELNRRMENYSLIL
jgi:lysophospholipase L1-like esterase